jgi:hypothetical protein
MNGINYLLDTNILNKFARMDNRVGKRFPVIVGVESNEIHLI